MGNTFQPGGGMYFNDVIAPTEKVNIARVTNVMTRFPHTAVSIQIIPTSFNENERLYFQRGRTGVNYMIGQIRIMPVAFKEAMHSCEHCVHCQSPWSSSLPGLAKRRR